MFEPSTLLSCTCCKIICGTGRGYARCGRCHLVAYCSEECQRRDWNDHKSRCVTRSATDSKISRNTWDILTKCPDYLNVNTLLATHDKTKHGILVTIMHSCSSPIGCSRTKCELFYLARSKLSDDMKRTLLSDTSQIFVDDRSDVPIFGTVRLDVIPEFAERAKAESKGHDMSTFESFYKHETLLEFIIEDRKIFTDNNKLILSPMRADIYNYIDEH